MNAETVRMSELAELGPSEKESRLRALVDASRRPPNGELRDLDAKIRQHEEAAGFDSTTLRQRLASGEQSETAIVCDWLMLLDLRERIASVASRTR